MLVISLFLNVVLGAYAVKRMYYIFVTMPKEEARAREERMFYKKWLIDLFASRPVESSHIVFLGDSHTEMFGTSEFFGAHVLNRGISGDSTGGVVLRLQEVTERKPKKIFLQIGINDLLQGFPLARTEANYQTILERIKRDSPNTVVYVQNLLPSSFGPLHNAVFRMQVQEMNTFLEALAKQHQVEFIDLYSLFQTEGRLNPLFDSGDELHLNAAGYALWARAIEDLVKTER